VIREELVARISDRFRYADFRGSISGEIPKTHNLSLLHNCVRLPGFKQLVQVGGGLVDRHTVMLPAEASELRKHPPCHAGLLFQLVTAGGRQ
jgi:hypothetical protein